MQLELLRHQLHQPGGNVFAGVEITEEDRKQLIHVLGGTVASEVETASLVNKIGIMQEELSAAQENLRAADEAGTATARAIERLSKENSGMRSMVRHLPHYVLSLRVMHINVRGMYRGRLCAVFKCDRLQLCSQRLTRWWKSPMTAIHWTRSQTHYVIEFLKFAPT